MSTQPQLAEAKNHINQVFGLGYASMHPELVGQYLIASTIQRLFDLSSGTGPLLKFLGIK